MARAPALDRKVPVTQTLSFCQMHFLSPLPVAFDRKLVSVIPVTVGQRYHYSRTAFP